MELFQKLNCLVGLIGLSDEYNLTSFDKDIEPTSQTMKIKASAFLVFDTEYTHFFAQKLVKKLKPKIGKTKELGAFEISGIETKSLIKLNNGTNLYRLITTSTTNESTEFFQSPMKVTQLVNSESDELNIKMRAAFNVNSMGNLTMVEIDDYSLYPIFI